MFNECLDYIYITPDIYFNLKDVIIPILKNFKTSFEHIEQILGIIKNNLADFLTSFESFSDTTIKFQKVITQYFESANLYLMQIRDVLNKISQWYYPDPFIDYSNPSKQDVFDIKVGWHSFWSTFRYKKFDEVLLEVHNKIQDEVNPLSEKNKGEFDSNIEKLKNDTAVGSALELKDGMQNFYTNISGASPTASLNVNLLPVKFYGASVPAKTIKIDFSWFAPYRDTALSLWRFFLWVGYIFLVFKRFPDILSGAGLITDISTNGNMTEGIENSFYNITMDDEGNVLSAIESHSYKEGNSTYRYNVRKDVGGSGSTDNVKR